MHKVTNKKREVASKINNEAKSKRRGAKKFLFVLSLMIAISLVAFQVYSNARLNELVNESAQLKKEAETLKSEKIQLNVEIEKKTDLREIERIASEELGMSKLSKHQVNYISLPALNKSVILKKDDEQKGVLSDIVKNFNIILEYLS